MIFSGQFRQPSGYIGYGTAICVYQGVQPTMDEYIADYDTSYNFASSNILKLIIKANATPTILQVSQDQYNHTTQAIKSFNSGVATWASIHRIPGDQSGGGGASHFSPEGYYFLSVII